MLFTTLVVITVLCLALPLTCIYGIACAAMLLYFYPIHTLTLLGVLVLGRLAFLYVNHRRTSHA